MPGFFGDDEGGREKRGGKDAGFLTKDAGPLPVWGWVAVGVAGIFLFRMIVKPKPAGDEATGAQQTPVPYPTGGVGGVFLIPGGSGSTPSTTPPPADGNDPPPSPPAASSSLAQLLQQVFAFQQGVLNSALAGASNIPSSIFSQLPDVLGSALGSATVDALSLRGGDGMDGTNFLRATAAAKAAGLPHVITGPGGPSVLNPRTNQSVSVTSWNTLSPSQRGSLQAGVGWDQLPNTIVHNVNENAA